MKEMENIKKKQIDELIINTLQYVNNYKKNLINNINALQNDKSKWGIQEQEFNDRETL